MPRLWQSVAFRLALGHAALVLSAMTVLSATLYFGTVGLLSREVDVTIHAASERLIRQYESGGSEQVAQSIAALLSDGIDQDTEAYLLVAPNGRVLAGNISSWDPRIARPEHLTDETVTRGELGAGSGQPSVSRLLLRRLPDGALLVVGRDIKEFRAIRALVIRALVVGCGATLFLAVVGLFLFRRELEQRVAAIRRTASEIEAGDLSRRIPILEMEDEFTRLNRDINRMLDRIQQLMEEVRDVSNAIAHDLRTPLTRIRSRLDEALQGEGGKGLGEAALEAVRGIDALIDLFDRLLQIAEAEAGMRRKSFAPIALRALVADVVELYDAAAEANQVTLSAEVEGAPEVSGDKQLLLSALTNLIDNAFKYASGLSRLRIRAGVRGGSVTLIVEDDGPGIPAAERAKVVGRFYRLDRSRSLPGNGLGLAVVAAICTLHGGTLTLEDASPGLRVRMVLPAAGAAAPAAARGALKPVSPSPARQPPRSRAIAG